MTFPYINSAERMRPIPSHNRAASYVKGHLRSGSWVSGHHRSATYVVGHERSETDPRPWSLADSGRQLTHLSQCPWCGAAVFFYRNEAGGFALFESLGRPWPVHGCWEDHMQRAAVLQRIDQELVEREYDGVFMPAALEALRKPVDNLRVVRVVGYVADNEALYNEDRSFRLSAHRRASTCDLAVVNVWSAGSLHPFVIPRVKAMAIKDYEPVTVAGTWLARGRVWHLVATGVTIDQQTDDLERIYLPQVRGLCAACGGVFGGAWGFTDDGRIECGPCGEMRGGLTRRDFIQRVKVIAQRNSRPSTGSGAPGAA